MSGVLALFRGRPKGEIGADGRMSLGDHARELRARVLRVVLYLVLGTILGLFFYKQLFELIIEPYNQALELLDSEVKSKVYVEGVGGALMLQLKLSGVFAIVGTSPLWLYEIWSFIVPGLHRQERRWTRIFALIAGPLFISGVVLGYVILPKAISVLISFTPDNVENLNNFNAFFTFITRMLLVFGVSFEIPLFVVLLNLAGVVSGAALGRHRPWIVLGTMVFAAIATPSTDPFSMLFLAIPMLVLFMISEMVARLVDRGRRKAREAEPEIDDDAISPL